MKLRIAAFLSLFGAALAAFPCQAGESFPGRTVRILIPFAPGGTTDIVARLLAEELKHSLGQPFVIENRPGADGQIALQELVRSPADGYTLLIGNVTTNAIAPILNAGRMSFDYRREIAPVMRLADVPAFLVATTKDFPPTTVADLVTYAGNHPGKVNFGTTGFGSYPHYDMALLARRAGGLHMAAIPNKNGASGMINDLLVGTVQLAFINAASVAPGIKAGTLRALAVANHARLKDFPDVPTMQEAGYPGVGTIAWQALFAHAAVPAPVLEKIRHATEQALQAQAVRQALEQQAFNLAPTHSLDEAKSWLASEMTHWSRVTEDVKLDMPE